MWNRSCPRAPGRRFPSRRCAAADHGATAHRPARARRWTRSTTAWGRGARLPGYWLHCRRVRTRAGRGRLQKAIADGELAPETPTREMVELLYAPLYYRLLLGTDELTEESVAALVELCQGGLGPGGRER
ncbi:TetR-like C-terminal domain-containing protein [Yinghuangia soli]|uniref:TetR/AcrR family transcriptional regulator C-terminal ligand-binding domain-containing protein n=1 Tax=Yinghuangia soli TaxID=2908204 RepID=A0AA41U4I0_9ACTN|nr:TetR-like C-terminal domain-containing protein [Yinghuangia soli]MCF2533758.1 TetR/AcrR family transcriptional regulator C-terminal ligand-binding domain-containing protein [Yinghuangia soli]